MEELSPTAAPLAQDGMDGCEQQEDQNSPDMGDLQPHSTPQPHSDTDGGTECLEATKEPLEGEWAAKVEPTCGAEHEERYGAGTVGLPHISAPEHSGVPGGDTELLQPPTPSQPAAPLCPVDADGDPASPSCTPRNEVALREDASAVLGGLILELSNLNRRVMSAHRALESLLRLLRRERSRGVNNSRRRRRRKMEGDETG